MSFVPPFDPNGPFYWPETNAVAGPNGPLIIGAGLSVTIEGDLIAIGGGPAVTYLYSGAGIHLSGGTGNVTITNIGVTDILAGTGIGLVKSGGVVTITNTAPAINLGGTVTSVATGTGLTGGPISTSGTISLANTGVAAATYTNPTIAVNAQGQITFATNGSVLNSVSGTAPIVVTGSNNAVISVNEGSPTTPGVLRISDSVANTSSNTAASSTAVKNAYDLASSALPCNLLVGQGDLISSTGAGTPLRIPAGAEGTYLKVCAACSGTAGLTWDTVALCGGTVTSVCAGPGLCGGDITTSGTISLDSTCVISPTALPSKGALLSASAASAPLALGLGSDGQYLTVNSSCLTGLEWVNAPASIPCSAFNVKGDILVGTSPGFYAALPVGANGEVLTACSLCAAGVTWVPTPPDGVQSVFGTAPVQVDNSDPVNPIISIDVASTSFPGVVRLEDAVTCSSTTLAATANAVKIAYDEAVSAQNQATTALSAAAAAQSTANQALSDAASAQSTADQAVLDAVSAQSDATQALADAADAQSAADQAALDAAAAQSIADAAIPCAAITGKGAILTGSAASTPSALAVGTNGKVLAANSACASGLEWITPASTPQASQTSLGTLFGLAGSPFGSNVAGGWGALGNLSTGNSNTAFGQCALYTNGFDSNNTAIGANALSQSNGGNGNTAIGNQAGFNLTTGDQNTIIGNSVDVPVATGSCQLAIGFPGGCWLTGCSNKNIKPGAGIIDCSGSAGTAGQVLMSNGSNAICWGTVSGGSGIPCSTITAKGALVTGTAANTPSGLTVGTNGQVLTACSACTTGLTWTTPAAGCTGTVTSVIAGTGLTGGTITTSGTIALDTTCVLQPSAFTAKGVILSASAASTPSALNVGTDGQILYACSTSATGLCWAAAPSGGSGTVTSICAGAGLCGGDITTSGTISLDTACVILPSALTAKGDIISASASSTPTALPVGTDGQVLSACSACASGLVWATPQTSPFITYTTSAISYTNGTPVLVAVWNGGFLQGTITLDLVGYGGVTPFWDIFLSGDATNYNTGWYQTAFWPPTTDGLSQGTWYVDFPVYPSANNGKWEFYFNPTQDALNPSSFTFFFRTNSVPTWQI